MRAIGQPYNPNKGSLAKNAIITAHQPKSSFTAGSTLVEYSG